MSIAPLGNGLNINSLRLQRNFMNQQLSLEHSLERLSSGLRINRAADHPSGITRARNTETRLISAGQALNNSSEASLLTASASASVQQMLNGLQNMRSLVLQSLNEVTTDPERQLLQNQFKQGSADIDRLARSTEFNSRHLLDGQAAPLQAMRLPEARILFNRDVTDTSPINPELISFIENIVALDPRIRTDSTIQFRLYESSAEFTAGLEIISSNLGTVVRTDNYLAFPNTYHLPVTEDGLTVTLNLANLGYNEIEPLTLDEYQNVNLSQLVADRRLLPISYGGLNLTLGGVTYDNVINVQPNHTLEEIVSQLNNLSGIAGSLSVSYDPVNRWVNMTYTHQREISETTQTSYTPARPGEAGGGFADFAALTSVGPEQGDPYLDPSGFLPTAPFDPTALGILFPTLPSSLNASLSFAGTQGSLLSALGLSNTTGSGHITGYTLGDYRGETMATGGQSEYVNRTTLEILSVSTEHQTSGSNTGLSAADATKSLAILNTAQVDQISSFGINDFSIDFGDNGIFTFANFNPQTQTIGDIVSAINQFASDHSVQVSASFDTGTQQLSLRNEVAAGLNNQIHFEGTLGDNSANLAQFFKLSNLDSTLGGENTVTSFEAISNQALDPDLGITGTELSNSTLNQLMTPKLDTLVSGDFYLNGDWVVTLNPETMGLNDLVAAIDGFVGSGNQVYSASFNNGVLQIAVTDTETLTPSGGSAPVNPGIAQIDGNRIVIDTAVYIASETPQNFGGTGPMEQLIFSAEPLSPEYLVNAPDPTAEDISGISFSGSNIAAVLFLTPAASGTAHLVAGSDQFRGEITAIDNNTYELAGTYQQTFSASTSITSSQRLGFETPLGQDPEFGVVAQLYVRAGKDAVTTDRSLHIQTGIDAGHSLKVGIEELTARTLRLEGLDLIGGNSTQTYLKGLTALHVIDDAIDNSIHVLAQLGAYQNALDRNTETLLQKQELLSAELSAIQDADIPTEISRMTRAQINVQAAAAALNENNLNQREIARLLFGALGNAP